MYIYIYAYTYFSFWTGLGTSELRMSSPCRQWLWQVEGQGQRDEKCHKHNVTFEAFSNEVYVCVYIYR